MESIYGGGTHFERLANGKIDYIENRINGETWRWQFVRDDLGRVIDIVSPVKIED